MEESEWDVANSFAIYNAYDEINELRNTPINQRELQIVQIDQYYMRELCCGQNANELMKQRLPDSEDFDKAIKHSKYKYEDYQL